MNALLIFIKNPEKGKVKTRLAQSVGDNKALQIYNALLGHTRYITSQIEANRYLYYSSFVDEQDEWPADLFQKKIQTGNDLGERMALAFEQAFEDNEKVVIIGSDCASLTVEIAQEAMHALDTHDFVIGPALDGGYYLLGMRTFEPSVFENIEWSTAEVLPQTVQRIQNLHKVVKLLPALSDIDYEEDWLRWGWEI